MLRTDRLDEAKGHLRAAAMPVSGFGNPNIVVVRLDEAFAILNSLAPSSEQVPDEAVLIAGDAFRQTLIPRADLMRNGYYPMWHGWALMDAFIAGAKYAATSAERAQEAVAWRREWEGDDSDIGMWVHADSPDERDEPLDRWQPLYAAPVVSPSATSAQQPFRNLLTLIEHRIEGWNERKEVITNGAITRDELIYVGNTLRGLLGEAEGRDA